MLFASLSLFWFFNSQTIYPKIIGSIRVYVCNNSSFTTLTSFLFYVIK
nr:MAG TPA: hypothetical protein [Caudoviricetes sp.]